MGVGIEVVPSHQANGSEEVVSEEEDFQQYNKRIYNNKTKKHTLNIHHTNLFRPTPLPIKKINLNSLGQEWLAVVKEHISETKNKKKIVNIIETYKINNVKIPKLQLTIYDYETITGIFWINNYHLMTVTKQQTINVYNLKRGVKVYTHVSDYGPITSSRVNLEHNLLLTGTEYGYAVVYSFTREFEEGQFELNFISKMVKVNERINSVDFSIIKKEGTESKEKIQKKKKKVKSKSSEKEIKNGKRKKPDDSSSESSSSSESENEQKDDQTFLGAYDINIFGACLNEVVAWNFHKKTIIERIHVGDPETCLVNALLTLKSGDLVTGNSDGTISFFDNNTLTCKYYTHILDGEILDVIKNDSENTIFVSGKDTPVAMLKQSILNKDEFVLFEKIELHSRDITCLSRAGKNGFVSGSVDGKIGQVRLRGLGRREKTTLEKKTLIHNYSDRINFTKRKMLIQSERSLMMYQLPKLKKSDEVPTDEEIARQNATKLLQLCARNFIHASAISGKFIAYATRKGINIYVNFDDKYHLYKTDRELTECNHLEFCFYDSILIAGQYDKCAIIDLRHILDKIRVGEIHEDESLRICPIIAEEKLSAAMNQIMFSKSCQTLYIGCSGPRAFIYVMRWKSKLEDLLKDAHQFHFKNHQLLFMAQNTCNSKDHNLYVYTTEDKIITLTPEAYNAEPHINDLYSSTKRIIGLPEDANILGMFILTNNICMLYDFKTIFKVDLKTNTVISSNDDYQYIIKLDNRAFGGGNEATLVELTPEDYDSGLPIIPPEQLKRMKRKFGT